MCILLVNNDNTKEINMNNYTMRKILCVSTLLLTMSGQVQAKVVDEIKQIFKVGKGSSLVLDNINGAVEINSWDQVNIEIIATIKAKNQESFDRITVEMEQQGSRVKVKTLYDDNTSSWDNNNNGSVSYQVNVPQDVSLTSIKLVNGSLGITGVEGSIKAELVNGSIVATGLMNNSEISSVNGSVSISYNGFNANFDEVEVETVNGDVSLYFPQSLNASIEVETINGDIKNSFGLTAEKGMLFGMDLNGIVASGDAEVSINSVNGAIKLLKK
jgi:DUF4097 and DUF4098 domain-containing protein YvlB